MPRRGGSQIRPSSVDRDARRARRLTGFRPFGRVSFPAMGKKPKDRREWAPMGVPAHSRATPGPPFTEDTPIRFRKSSGAQNTVPDFIPPGPLGPGAVQNSGLCHFTAAPGSDQLWQMAQVGGRTGRNRSENRKRAGQCPAPTACQTNRRDSGRGKPLPYGVTEKHSAADGGRLHGTAPTQGNTPRCRPGRGGATLSPTGRGGRSAPPCKNFRLPVTIRAEEAFHQ